MDSPLLEYIDYQRFIQYCNPDPQKKAGVWIVFAISRLIFNYLQQNRIHISLKDSAESLFVYTQQAGQLCRTGSIPG